MTSDDESLSTLVDLGLSTSQAKIYLALLMRQMSSAREVSSISKVSRPDVYRIIAQLEGLQLVERLVGKPTKYRATPLEASTSILMQSKMRELAEIKKRIPILIQHVGEKHGKQKEPDEFTISIIPREVFYIKSAQMIKSARKSVYAIIPTAQVVSPPLDYQKALGEALSRNADFRVIVSFSNEKLKNTVYEDAFRSRNFQLRYTKETPITTIGIFDGEQAVINTKPGENFDATVFMSSNKCILALCEFYFKSLWNESFSEI